MSMTSSNSENVSSDNGLAKKESGALVERSSDRINSSCNQHLDMMGEARELSDKAATKQATNSKSVNVILMGETGVGKTSFINGGANFLKFGSMAEALKNGPSFLVDTSFTMTTQSLETVKVFIPANTAEGKENSQNEGQTDGQSKTRDPLVHKISWKEEAEIKTINLIDTPGMMDTLGRAVDEQNQQKISQKLLEIGNINAVLILLKPNESRLKLGFRVSLTKILNMVAEIPAENLLFCFTNTQSLSYRPGDSMVPLIALLKDFSSDQRPLTANKSNIFCFDSNPIRQLAEILSKKCETKNGAHIKATEDDWQKNVASWKELLKKIEELVPYEIKSLTIDESIAPERAEDPPPEIQLTDDLPENIDEKLPPSKIKNPTIEPPIIDESIAPERAEDPPPEIKATDDLPEKNEKLPPSERKSSTIEPIDEPIASERIENPPPKIQLTDDLLEKNEKLSPSEIKSPATEAIDGPIASTINSSEEIPTPERIEDPPPTEMQPPEKIELPPSENLIVDPKTKNAIKEQLELMSEKITKIKRKEVDTENTLEKLKSNCNIFKSQATDILDKESTYKVIEGDETYMICMNEECNVPVKLITGETVPKKCYFPCETEIFFKKRTRIIFLRCLAYFLHSELLIYLIFFPSWMHLYSLRLLLMTILPSPVGNFVNKLKNFSHEQYLMKLKMGSKCTQCGCEIQDHQPTKKQLVAILKPDVEREYKETIKDIEKTLMGQRHCEEHQKTLEEKYSSLANNAAELSASFFFYFSNEKSDPFLIYLEAIQSNERMKKTEVDKLLLNKLKMIENEHKERVQEFLCQMEDGLRKSVEFEEINATMALRKTSRNILQ